jgi:hypothetical protein
MLNEGIVTTDTTTAMKSEMIRQLRKLGRATPDAWERAVFTSLTGQTREDVDWEVEDNQAGYRTWIKAFDELAQELIEDGYGRLEKGAGGERVIVAESVDPSVGWSEIAYRTA